MKVSTLYKQIRAHWHGNTAQAAIGIARRHIAGPLAAYHAAKKAWEAEPDKRRFAPGGAANRPKYPQLYSRCAHDDAVPDGYVLFGFLKSDSTREGLSDSPDFGYYADSWYDCTYQPCVLIRRTSEPHVWACIPAYFDSCGEEYRFTDRNPRDLARSEELFRTDNYGTGCKETDGYSLAQDVKDAARAALSLAERDAEEAREYDEKWQEASSANDARDAARDELKAARAEAVRIITASRTCFDGAILAILRDKVQECRDDMRTALETIAEKTDAIAALDMSEEFA